MLLSLLEVVWDSLKDMIEVCPECNQTADLGDLESYTRHLQLAHLHET